MKCKTRRLEKYDKCYMNTANNDMKYKYHLSYNYLIRIQLDMVSIE